MAFRTSQVYNGTGQTLALTLPSGLQYGDLLVMFIVTTTATCNQTDWGDHGNEGWTLFTQFSTTTPVVRNVTIYVRHYGETYYESRSYMNLAPVLSASDTYSIIIGAWSGRMSKYPDFTINTVSNVANTTPVSFTASGVTPLASSDMVVFKALAKSVGTDVWSLGTTTGYTNRQNINSGVQTVGLDTLDAVSAGATGNLVSTATRTTGTGTAGYLAFTFYIEPLPPFPSSLHFGNTQYGVDFTTVPSPPSNDVLVCCWHKPDGGVGDYPRNTDTNGDFFTFQFWGPYLYWGVLGGNLGADSPLAASMNENCSLGFYTAGNGASTVQYSYYTDFTYYQSQSSYTESQIYDWTWSAWQCNITSSQMTLRQWTLPPPYTQLIFFESIVTLASVQTYTPDSGATYPYASLTGFGTYNSLQIGSGGRGSIAHARIYSSQTAKPTNTALMAIAQNMGNDTTAWADYPMAWTGSGTSYLNDFSGHGRTMVVGDGTHGVMWPGYPNPPALPSITGINTYIPAANNAASYTQTITAPVSGNTLLVVVAMGVSGIFTSVTTNLGATAVVDYTSSNGRVKICRFSNVTTGPTSVIITFTTAGDYKMVVFEVAGLANAGPTYTASLTDGVTPTGFTGNYVATIPAAGSFIIGDWYSGNTSVNMLQLTPSTTNATNDLAAHAPLWGYTLASGSQTYSATFDTSIAPSTTLLTMAVYAGNTGPSGNSRGMSIGGNVAVGAMLMNASSGNLYSVSTTESGSALDAPNSVYTTLASQIEAGTGAAVPSAVQTQTVSQTEAGTGLDTPMVTWATAGIQTEAGSAVDAPTTSMQATATQSEAGAAVDSPVSTGSVSVSQTDSGTATDTPTTTAAMGTTITESGTGADAPTAVQLIASSQSESGAASDGPAASMVGVVAQSEAGSAADAPTVSASMGTTQTEAGSSADSLTVTQASAVTQLEAPGDPLFQSVTVLLHGEGTTVVDSGPLGLTFTNSGVTTTTAHVITGSKSLTVADGGYLQAAPAVAQQLGTGDFTIECKLNLTNSNTSTYNLVYDGATGGANSNRVGTFCCYIDSVGRPVVYNISGSYTAASGLTWGVDTHVAWVRFNGVLTAYVAGTAVGSWPFTINETVGGITVGNGDNSRGTAGASLVGYIDEFRITKAARYTGNFTPTSLAFPDRVGGYDILSGGIATSVTQTESGSAADAPTGASIQVTNQAEAGTAIDSPTVSAAMTASQSEAGAGTDASTVLLGTTAAQAEAGTAADTPSTTMQAVSSQAEAGTASDAPSGILSMNSTQVEAGSAVDTKDSLSSGYNSITEPSTAVDSVSTAWAATASQTDSGTALDTPTAVQTQVTTMAEAGSAADSPSTTQTQVVTQTDAGSAASAQDSTNATTSSQGEPASAADTPTASWTATASQSDSGAAVDTTLGGSVLVVSQAESGASADLPSVAQTQPVAQAEAGSASDTPSTTWSTGSAITEPGAAGDQPSTTLTMVVSQTDSGSAVDASTGSANWLVGVAEAGGAVEFLVAGNGISVTITEAGTGIDTLTAIAQMVSAVIEAGLASDTESAVQLIAITHQESGTATDALTVTAQAVASMVEAANAADASTGITTLKYAGVVESGNATDYAISNYVMSIVEAAYALDTSYLGATTALAGIVVFTPAQVWAIAIDQHATFVTLKAESSFVNTGIKDVFIKT